MLYRRVTITEDIEFQIRDRRWIVYYALVCAGTVDLLYLGQPIEKVLLQNAGRMFV